MECDKNTMPILLAIRRYHGSDYASMLHTKCAIWQVPSQGTKQSQARLARCGSYADSRFTMA